MTLAEGQLRVVVLSCSGAPLSAEVLTAACELEPAIREEIVGVVRSGTRPPRKRALTEERRRDSQRAMRELAAALRYRFNALKRRCTRGTKRLARAGGVLPAGKWQRIEEFCDETGVPTHFTRDATAPETLEFVRSLRPDALLMITFHHILRAPLLEIPAKGVFNVHCSLLPEFRGPDPIGEALRVDARTTGVTIHWVDEGIDTGEIAHQARVEIPTDADEPTLRRALATRAGQLVVTLLTELRTGTPTRRPQSD